MAFESTDWTVLITARDRSASPGADAFARLIAAYQAAMLDHVRRRFRVETEMAQDIVQQFIVERLLEQNLLAKADRSRGKFRALLVTSLNNFCVDYFKRKLNRPVPSDDVDDLDSAVDPIDPFDRAWAEGILAEALAQTSTQLIAGGREHYWKLFVARVVRAAYDEPEPAEYSVLCQALGFHSPRDATNALTTAKRTFERVISDLLAGQGGKVDDALADLRTILGSRAVESLSGRSPL